MIAILDYGMGNLRSAEKALERVGADVVRTGDPAVAGGADGLILPGVGAFPEAMSRIRERGFDALIRERVDAGVPLLGICLGMQLLFDSSVELGGAEGLGLVAGEVTALDAGARKVPHIGWSPVTWTRESSLTVGTRSGEPFYFVHTFAPRARDEEALATAEYGERFICAVERGNVYGFQFHPEKSSAAGLRLLGNFASICAPNKPAQQRRGSASLRSASHTA